MSNDLTILLALGSFLFAVGACVVLFVQTKNFVAAYDKFVTMLVSNDPLVTELQDSYSRLSPDQVKYADLGLEMIKELSKATADQTDDVLQAWVDKIKAAKNS